MYDDENNSLDFKYNGDYSEEPRGAYLSTTSGYDLSNGFTFEFFGNLRNIEQKQDKVTYDAGMGLFCLGPNIWKDSGKVLGFGYNKSGLFANMGPSSAHWCGDVYVGPYGGTVAKGLKFPAGEDVYITITYQVGEGGVSGNEFDDLLLLYINGEVVTEADFKHDEWLKNQDYFRWNVNTDLHRGYDVECAYNNVLFGWYCTLLKILY